MTAARAVDQLFAAASAEEARSLDGLVQVAVRQRDRGIVVERAPLPYGTFGRVSPQQDHDQILYADWVQCPLQTISHELGHIVLEHSGMAKDQFVHSYVVPKDSHYAADLHAMADLMARPSTVMPMPAQYRACRTSTDWSDEEVQAELFAGLLLERLDVGRRARRPATMSRLAGAFG